jgi:hypothetical protein
VAGQVVPDKLPGSVVFAFSVFFDLFLSVLAAALIRLLVEILHAVTAMFLPDAEEFVIPGELVKRFKFLTMGTLLQFKPRGVGTVKGTGKEKAPTRSEGFQSSGDRIRTCDLRVMSPTSCLCSTPQRQERLYQIDAMRQTDLQIAHIEPLILSRSGCD